MSYVIQHGIAFHQKETLNEVCRKQKFSIILDECTDISETQILTVIVRYYDSDEQDVVDALLDTVTVENGTAESLYNGVKNLLKERDIPIGNVIGFGSDNYCSTMMGKRNGFQKLLRNDVPSLFIMGCVCHSFALCANHAVGVLPSYLETLMRDVSSYFSRSGKRLRDFVLIEEVTNTSSVKIPKLLQTRWLSRQKVISFYIR